MTLLMRGDSRGESLPVRPDVLREVVQLVVLRQRDHEFERNRHRFGAAQGRASLDPSTVDAPFPGRQADRAAGLSVKQAVLLDVVEDRARGRPADRVVPGRTARLEHDPLSLWSKTGTLPENDEYKDGERKKACLAVNVAGYMLENVTEINHPPSCQAFIAGNGRMPTRVTARQARIQEPSQACRLLTPADVHHGWRSSEWRRARRCSPRRTPRIRNASPPAPPIRRRGPREGGANPPKTSRQREHAAPVSLATRRPG